MVMISFRCFWPNREKVIRGAVFSSDENNNAERC